MLRMVLGKKIVAGFATFGLIAAVFMNNFASADAHGNDMYKKQGNHENHSMMNHGEKSYGSAQKKEGGQRFMNPKAQRNLQVAKNLPAEQKQALLDRLKGLYQKAERPVVKNRIKAMYEAIAGKELSTDTIVDIAVGNTNFSTLVTAVSAAGLVETLAGEGPFTVFAPTNDAFAKVDQSTLESLLLPENLSMLTDVLTYHVVPGNIRAADLKDGQELTTVNGKKLLVRIQNGTVSVGGSTVTSADIEGINGIIHVIDTVLIP